MKQPFNSRELALGDAIREQIGDFIDTPGTSGSGAMHVILAQAAGLLEAMTCCDKHFARNLREMADWFIECGQFIHEQAQSSGECPPEPAGTATVEVRAVDATTPESILADTGLGLVAYAGQSFGKNGLKPLFMACLTRDLYEAMVAKGVGFDVDIDVNGQLLNLRLFARETRQDALDLIASRQMTEEQVKAVAEMQGATKQ